MQDIKIKKIIHKQDIPFDLLLLADPSKDLVKQYTKTWQIFWAYLDDKIVGVYVLILLHTQIFEIINIAVDTAFQGKGIWTMLIVDAIQKAKDMHAKKLEIWTWNSSSAQLALYQKCGFKVHSVDKGFFSRNYKKKIIENGIECTDMIRLRMDLL